MSPMLRKEALVAADPHSVWAAWTDVADTRTFFAPNGRIDLRLGGAYELYFDDEAAVGLRGSEGCQVLAYVPDEMLAFSWNAPPEIPEVRNLRPMPAWVVVTFASEGEDTRVRLSHLGFGEGEGWERTYAYFDHAWSVVLERLQRRFVEGPIHWETL